MKITNRTKLSQLKFYELKLKRIINKFNINHKNLKIGITLSLHISLSTHKYQFGFTSVADNVRKSDSLYIAVTLQNY